MCAPTKSTAAPPTAKEQRDICQLCGTITTMSDFRTRAVGFSICKTCNAGYESGAYCAIGIAQEIRTARAERRDYGHLPSRKRKIAAAPYRGAAVGIIHETRQHNAGLSIITAPSMSLDSILRAHGYVPPPPLPRPESPRRRQTRVQAAADQFVELIRAERQAATMAAAPPRPAPPAIEQPACPPARRRTLRMIDPSARRPIEVSAAGALALAAACDFDPWEAANY